MTDYILTYESQMASIRLDFGADKPRMNSEFEVMMAEL